MIPLVTRALAAVYAPLGQLRICLGTAGRSTVRRAYCKNSMTAVPDLTS